MALREEYDNYSFVLPFSRKVVKIIYVLFNRITRFYLLLVATEKNIHGNYGIILDSKRENKKIGYYFIQNLH